MINENKVLALIPARGGSKGLPRKNIRPLDGKPLIGWPIDTAKNSKYIDKVIVSTDDKEIAEVAESLGAEIPFIRPSEFAMDNSPRNMLIKHAIDFFDTENFKYLVYLEPTSPLTETDDIDNAIEILNDNRDIADSIVSVSELISLHPDFLVSTSQKGLIVPHSSKTFIFKQRQEISQLFFFDGSLYISCIQSFLREREFIHERTLPYFIPKWKSFEIDDIVDFICIEEIMKKKEIIKGYYDEGTKAVE